MIRSFSRNGLVQRSLISSCNRKLTVPLGLGYLPGRTLGVYRLVSTSPDQKASPLPEKDLPPPASRKHKVELRPSPVKPPPKSLSSEPRPSSLPRSDSAPTQLDVKEKPLKQPTSASESTVSSPKYDYDAALKHSILAPPPADASKAGRLWHQFKEIFKFYIRGIKRINIHRKHVNAIESRVKSGGEPLSRWEARFIGTHRQDVIKLVPFLLICTILEEIIPIIVLYAPFMLPSTCILPSQQERIVQKRRSKIQIYSATMRAEFQNIFERSSPSVSSPLNQFLRGTEISAMCGVLSLSTLGPVPLRMNRLERHFQRIAEDDNLLNKEGMDQRLTLTELQETLDERGFVTNGLEKEVMRANLRWWLTRVRDVAPEEAASWRALLVATVNSGNVETK